MVLLESLLYRNTNVSIRYRGAWDITDLSLPAINSFPTGTLLSVPEDVYVGGLKYKKDTFIYNNGESWLTTNSVDVDSQTVTEADDLDNYTGEYPYLILQIVNVPESLVETTANLPEQTAGVLEVFNETQTQRYTTVSNKIYTRKFNETWVSITTKAETDIEFYSKVTYNEYVTLAVVIDPPPPNEDFEWTSERMKTNITFRNYDEPDSPLTVEFDMQNMGDLCFTQISVLGNDGNPRISSLETPGFGDRLYGRAALSEDVIPEEHRPETPHHVPLYSYWSSTNGYRRVIAFLHIENSGEVSLHNVDTTYDNQRGFTGVDNSQDTSNTNPPGMAVHSMLWRLG